jgi:hypothetical protein
MMNYYVFMTQTKYPVAGKRFQELIKYFSGRQGYAFA